MFPNNLTRVKWSKKTSSHDDGVIVYKIWTLCNLCCSTILTFIPLVQCTHSPFNIPFKCYSLVWCITEVTYHIYPNTRKEFFLNLTHLKNWSGLLTVHKVEHSLFVHIMKTNFVYYLFSVYFVHQPLHVSDIFVVHHQEVYYIYIQQLVCIVLFSWLSIVWVGMEQSTKKHSTYQLLYIYSIPPDDGLQICPKHVEVDWWNKLRINSVSSWFSLHGCIEMHGQQNIKKHSVYFPENW